jgi:alpha-tubulin suppressor-like RCC1 family protein
MRRTGRSFRRSAAAVTAAAAVVLSMTAVPQAGAEPVSAPPPGVVTVPGGVPQATSPDGAAPSVWLPGSYGLATIKRLLDTRTGRPLAAMGSTSLSVVGGSTGVPAQGVTAVQVTITVVNPTAAGNISAGADGAVTLSTSRVNFAPGQVVANNALLPVSSDGRIQLTNYSRGTTDVLVDISGYVLGGDQVYSGGTVPVAQTRLLDTRTVRAVAPLETVTVPVAGAATGHVPDDAAMVWVNLTAVSPTVAGDLQAYPAGDPIPGTSTLNFAKGQTVANAALVPVGDDGAITVRNESRGSTQILVDVVGYVQGDVNPFGAVAAGDTLALDPFRVLDTRTGVGAPRGAVAPGATVGVTVAADQVAELAPPGVAAVIANVTVTSPTQFGNLTAFASGRTRPSASTLNFVAGQTVANGAVIPVGADGRINIWNSSRGSAQVIVDITGWVWADDQIEIARSVYSWGDNTSGQLGRTTTTDASKATPTQIPGLTAVAGASGSGAVTGTTPSGTTYAVTLDGSAWSWGSNTDGALGDPSITAASTATPAKIPGLSNVVQIVGGGQADGGGTAAYALDADGAVWAWGDNSKGQLGRPLSTPNSATPLRVPGLGYVRSLAAGNGTAYAVTSTRAVMAWGDNTSGALGQPLSPTPVTTPTQVPGLSKVYGVAATAQSAIARQTDGTVKSWGDNGVGQLGRATTGSAPDPVPAAVAVTGTTLITGNLDTVYVADRAGALRTFGTNSLGQLGQGLTPDGAPHPTPGVVTFPAGTELSTVAALGVNGYVVDSTGQLWSWGANNVGALGTGTVGGPPAVTPVQAGSVDDGIFDVWGGVTSLSPLGFSSNPLAVPAA